jgi:hypothetical protein
MHRLTKAFGIIFLLTMLLAFEQQIMVSADILEVDQASPLKEKAVTYVKNVLPFDINHYNLTASGVISLPSIPNDPTVWSEVKVDLKTSKS